MNWISGILSWIIPFLFFIKIISFVPRPIRLIRRCLFSCMYTVWDRSVGRFSLMIEGIRTIWCRVGFHLLPIRVGCFCRLVWRIDCVLWSCWVTRAVFWRLKPFQGWNWVTGWYGGFEYRRHCFADRLYSVLGQGCMAFGKESGPFSPVRVTSSCCWLSSLDTEVTSEDCR